MIGKMLGNRYELIEKIGEGGMGLVYKAKCHLLNRYVAVKILKPELTEDEEFINKFKKESLSSASLSHPNIVNIYDVGVEDGIYYIVMEYVKGKTLKELIREKAPMSYYEVINIGRQICLALEHAHSNSIIHRDIKPQNIMITNDSIVKVGDFGIARVSNSTTLTNTGSVLGSAYYISPEQARGGYTDEKTDIYSLGTVMYEMATGQVPFNGETPVAVAIKHIQEEVVRPSKLNPDIPVALEDIILKALEKNPAYRYESSTAMIKDLDRALASPENHVAPKRESMNEMTRVMPAIKDSEIENIKKPKKKSSVKLIIAAVSVLLAAAAIGVIFAYINVNRPKEVAVPNIIGQTEENARDMLTKSGLSMVVSERKNSDKPEGTVLTTNPEVGMQVKQNATITVKISAGPEKVELPDFSGDSIDDVNSTLDNLGLKKNVIEVYSSDVDKNKVVKQSPGAKAKVDSGSTVDIYVSKGPEIKVVKVPPLIGLLKENVAKALTDAGLRLGKVKDGYDESKPDGVVLDQSVQADTEVKADQAIDITVNNLKAAVTPTPVPSTAPSVTPAPAGQ